MKHFISKAKDLSQRAAELKAAVERLPPKIAEVRGTIAATAGQLQQLKSEIQYSVADLAVEDEQRLTEALQEIDGSADILAKSGYMVHGVDFEISPIQRMLIHLVRLEEVSSSVIRALAAANKQRRTIHAILSSLLQAQQMAETVKLTDLTYAEVSVGVGPVPSVRLRWRAVEARPVSTPIPPAAPATSPAFSQSSYFEKPQPQTTPVSSTVAADVPPAPQVATLPSPPVDRSVAIESAGGTEEKVDPLARFKKMPTWAKSGR